MYFNRYFNIRGGGGGTCGVGPKVINDGEIPHLLGPPSARAAQTPAGLGCTRSHSHTDVPFLGDLQEGSQGDFLGAPSSTQDIMKKISSTKPSQSTRAHDARVDWDIGTFCVPGLQMNLYIYVFPVCK